MLLTHSATTKNSAYYPSHRPRAKQSSFSPNKLPSEQSCYCDDSNDRCSPSTTNNSPEKKQKRKNVIMSSLSVIGCSSNGNPLNTISPYKSGVQSSSSPPPPHQPSQPHHYQRQLSLSSQAASQTMSTPDKRSDTYIRKNHSE